MRNEISFLGLNWVINDSFLDISDCLVISSYFSCYLFLTGKCLLLFYFSVLFMFSCQQISITIYIGLFKYSVPMILLMLQILDMLLKAMYQAPT